MLIVRQMAVEFHNLFLCSFLKPRKGLPELFEILIHTIHQVLLIDWLLGLQLLFIFLYLLLLVFSWLFGGQFPQSPPIVC